MLFWERVTTYGETTHTKEEDGCSYVLYLMAKPDLKIEYEFRERIPGDYVNVCRGTMDIDPIEQRIIRHTLHDVYGDCFTPDAFFILSMFFDDIDTYTPIPLTEIV